MVAERQAGRVLHGDARAARGRRLDQTIDENFAAFDDRRVVLAAQPYLDVASAGLEARRRASAVNAFSVNDTAASSEVKSFGASAM